VRVHGEDHVLRQLGLDSLADLRELDHRHPDRVAGDVAELVAAVDEPLRDGAVDVVGARSRAHRPGSRLHVLLVGFQHALRLLAGLTGGDRPRDLHPVAAGAGDLERGQDDVALLDATLAARDPELGQRRARLLADEHHVHRQPPAPLFDEVALAGREHLGLGPPRLELLEEDPEPLCVDADAVADGRQLPLALDSAGVVELDVERDELRAAVRERAVVAHGHDVVEAVDADPLPAALTRPVPHPRARRLNEDLLLDPRRRVLAHVPCLAREDDRGLALERQDDVGVAVHDHEAGEVRHRPLEARVLAAGDDGGVEPVPLERLANVPVAALDVRAHCCHDASSPLISAVTPSFSGVGTPCSRPKRAMPPFR
jgi:hypothetical protein